MNIAVIGGNLIGAGGILDAMRRQYRQTTGAVLNIDAALVCCTLGEHWRILGSRHLLAYRTHEVLLLQEKGTWPLENAGDSLESLKTWREYATAHNSRPFLLHPWRRKEHFERPALARRLNETFETLSKESGVPLICAARAWEEWAQMGGESLYEDTGNHANARGAEITAALILNTIIPGFGGSLREAGILRSAAAEAYQRA
jgi:hypothetical protein